ncbi:MAG: type IV pilus secretin PilQ [Acidobacteriota bacterium]|nr:type IV pilus secretin PilQ [Acidobacteriota bacterium]
MRRLRIGVLGVMLAAAAAATAAHPAASGTAIRLLSIGGETDGGAHVIVIESSEPAAYAVARPDPLTVLIDLRGVVAGSAKNRFRPAAGAPVSSVLIDEMRAPDGTPLTRIAMLLTSPASHSVVSAKGKIKVSFRGSAGSTGSTGSVPKVPGATVLSAVDVASSGALTRVTLAGNGWLAPSSLDEVAATSGGAHVVVDLPGVAAVAGLAPNAAGVLTGVRTEMLSREPLVTRVTMQLKARTAFRAERAGEAGNNYVVIFDTAAPVVDDAFGPEIVPEPASPSARVSPAAPSAPASPAPRRSSDFATAAGAPSINPMSALQQAPAPAPPATSSQISQPSANAGRQYQGHNISLDLQGSELKDVLRLLANISGLNMIVDSAVEGAVFINLTDVPWDQALDVVLRAHNLGYTIDGTVVRIARLSTLEAEEKQRAALDLARSEAGELIVRTYSLSYAKAQEMGQMLTSGRILSQRGQTVIDPRTNTLIITDLASRHQTAENLIRGLDRPEPQVEIEARIVQTSRDFAKSIGIQWGLNGQVSPTIGNTTGLAFPNTGSLTGSTPGGNVVDLGLEAPTSGISLSLGAINGAFNLDVALQALERSGKGRVLSTPRVTTQNNNQAEMYQGIQIPIQTVANNTITVTFKDAALSLRVTPQVTAAGTVIMQIELENATADFSRQVNGIPPIDTQRALTRVQIDDGATTVIGGIFVSREQATQSRTPVLHRIPLLGWLFKRDEAQDESRELLIFITPRILRS